MTKPNKQNEYSASPLQLAKFCSKGKYIDAAHIVHIDNMIMKMLNKKFKRLIINMPPRHGKSEYISKYFPLWFLCSFPDKRIILTSYQQRIASAFGRRVLALMNEFGEELFGIKINPKSRSAAEFEIENHDGGMLSVGVGGALTGKGADLLIIDDPVKNDKEANSQLIRDNTWEWFRSTAYSRLEPEGLVVLLMTRWHEDDLCGRLLNNSNETDEFEDENWEKIVFPAIATDKDTLGRCSGEALWKARFPDKNLLKIRNTVGEYWFSALYQQSPNPSGGGIFKKSSFRYFSSDNENYYLFSNFEPGIPLKSVIKEECSVYATVDLAVTVKARSDYTVVLVFALTKAKEILILDVIRDKYSASEHLELLEKIFAIYQPLMIGIESVQYQSVLVQTAQQKGLPAYGLRPDGDKVLRAMPISAKLDFGMVYFQKNAKWLDAFEQELLMFPNGRHDDMVDAFSYISALIKPIADANPLSAKLSGWYKSSLLKGY